MSSDWELIEKIKEDACDTSFLELKAKYEKVFYKVYNFYLPTMRAKGVDYEDIYESIDSFLMECIQRYSREKNGFSGLLWLVTQFACLNRINKKPSLFITDEVPELSFDPRESNEELRDHLDFLLANFQNPKIPEVCRARFTGKRQYNGWNRVSKEVGLSVRESEKLFASGLKELSSKI